VDDDPVRTVRGQLLDDGRLRDLAAHEHGLRAGSAHRLRRGLGGAVVPHVPEHRASRAVADEPERNGKPDPPCPAGHEDRRAVQVHLPGSGESAGAALGSSDQPGRERGSRPPFAALLEAWPRRSRRSICSSA
jgi:hypothetical protein